MFTANTHVAQLLSRPHTPIARTTPPDPPPISENASVVVLTDAASNGQPLKPDSTAHETTGSQSQVQGQDVNYGMALDGVSLGVLMLGAAIAATPGLQTASAVYTTVASGADRLSRTAKRATHLSRSFRGVGCTDDTLSNGWVEVSSQDVE
ncbi:unnamed protein product [Rhizoctonia solani]|uniref:Uncharacterized protein n=1 Tax=Rhizoctonia solani TaxID=456999 RepID=A0A8H3I1P4_9AGAM|nr:unnamed protein product [Rhizoctonia solani]